MKRDPTDVLREALVHFTQLEEYATRGLEEQIVMDAACLRLASGIEALAHLDPDVAHRLFGESWGDMWGMRNRLAHAYLLVIPERVRETIARDVPGVVATIRAELKT